MSQIQNESWNSEYILLIFESHNWQPLTGSSLEQIGDVPVHGHFGYFNSLRPSDAYLRR